MRLLYIIILINIYSLIFSGLIKQKNNKIFFDDHNVSIIFPNDWEEISLVSNNIFKITNNTNFSIKKYKYYELEPKMAFSDKKGNLCLFLNIYFKKNKNYYLLINKYFDDIKKQNSAKEFKEINYNIDYYNVKGIRIINDNFIILSLIFINNEIEDVFSITYILLKSSYSKLLAENISKSLASIKYKK